MSRNACEYRRNGNNLHFSHHKQNRNLKILQTLICQIILIKNYLTMYFIGSIIKKIQEMILLHHMIKATGRLQECTEENVSIAYAHSATITPR